MEAAPPTLLVPRTPGALCEFCETLATADCRIEYPQKHLKLSAARGCALCRMLFEELICNLVTIDFFKSSLALTRQHGDIQILDFNETLHNFELFSVSGKLLSNSIQAYTD